MLSHLKYSHNLPLSCVLSLAFQSHSLCLPMEAKWLFFNAVTNVTWFKFSVLLLISKVMLEHCVIIGNPMQCPPMSHTGHHLAYQKNVPWKRDETVISHSHSACCLILKSTTVSLSTCLLIKGIKKEKQLGKARILLWDCSSMFFGCVCLKTCCEFVVFCVPIATIWVFILSALKLAQKEKDPRRLI